MNIIRDLDEAIAAGMCASLLFGFGGSPGINKLGLTFGFHEWRGIITEQLHDDIEMGHLGSLARLSDRDVAGHPASMV